MAKLDGKLALITGRSSGIGLATAMRFVDEGAHVFITGRREAELASAVKDIGKNVKALKGDVPKLDELGIIATSSYRVASTRSGDCRLPHIISPCLDRSEPR
jgi:NADP-dependent 3-hydroxy acid dehydrogenase YdfG